MIVKIDIKGDIIQANIPFSEKEITFDQFCEYMNYYIKLIESDDLSMVESMLDIFDKNLKKLPFGDESIYSLFTEGYTLEGGDQINCLRVIAHIDYILQNCLSIYASNLLSKVNTNDPDILESVELVRSKNTYVKYRALLKLAAEINGLDYDGSSISINLEGEIYSLYQSSVSKFYSDGITGGEYVEVMEYRRKVASILEDKNLYFDGLHELKNALHLTAVLFRKQGEDLPIDRAKLSQFKNERMNLFKSLTLDQALEIGFFLTSSLQQLGLTKILEHTGILQTTKPQARILRKV